MRKMLKKFNVKLIILESIALIFIINGIKKLHIASQGEKYDALINEDWEKFQLLTDERIVAFFINESNWTLGIIVIGVLVIGLINWKNNIGIINSIVLFIGMLGMSATGFFEAGMINRSLNSFCGIFADDFAMAFFIGGLILTLIGITIVWKAIDMNKKHSTVLRQ